MISHQSSCESIEMNQSQQRYSFGISEWESIESKQHKAQREKKLKKYYELQYQVCIEQYDTSRNQKQQLEVQENLLFQLLKLRCQTGDILLSAEKVNFSFRESFCSYLKKDMQYFMKEFAPKYCFVVIQGDQYSFIPYQTSMKNFFALEKGGYTFIAYKLQSQTIFLEKPETVQSEEQKEEEQEQEQLQELQESSQESLPPINQSSSCSSQKLQFSTRPNSRSNSRHNIPRLSQKYINLPNNFSKRLQEQLENAKFQQQAKIKPVNKSHRRCKTQILSSTQSLNFHTYKSDKNIEQETTNHNINQTNNNNQTNYCNNNYNVSSFFVGQRPIQYLNKQIQSLVKKEMVIKKLNRINAKRLSFFKQDNPDLSLPTKIQFFEIAKQYKNHLNIKKKNIQFYSCEQIASALRESFRSQGIVPKMILVKGMPVGEQFWDFTCQSKGVLQSFELISNKVIVICL